mgnify:CR=1 FL=1
MQYLSEAVEEDCRLRLEDRGADLLAQKVRGNAHRRLRRVDDVPLRQVRRPGLRQRLDEVTGAVARLRLVPENYRRHPTEAAVGADQGPRVGWARAVAMR